MGSGVGEGAGMSSCCLKCLPSDGHPTHHPLPSSLPLYLLLFILGREGVISMPHLWSPYYLPMSVPAFPTYFALLLFAHTRDRLTYCTPLPSPFSHTPACIVAVHAAFLPTCTPFVPLLLPSGGCWRRYCIPGGAVVTSLTPTPSSVSQW